MKATLVVGRERLINGEVNLAAFDRVAVLNLCARIAKLCKDFILRIIDENIAIGEVENFGTAMLTSLIPPSVPKLPADLKCNRRLTCSGRHRKKNAALAGNNCFNGAIDRDFLIVTLALAKREVNRC